MSNKLIYQIIKGTKKCNQINYIVNDNKIETDPQEISNFIFNKYNEQFSKSTQPKDLSFWLNDTPKVTTTDNLINFDTNIVKNILTHKSNTAPGPDQIKHDIFKFLAIHNSCLFELISNLYNKMIHLNHIPPEWKEGNTILLPKQDNSVNS